MTSTLGKVGRLQVLIGGTLILVGRLQALIGRTLNPTRWLHRLLEGDLVAPEVPGNTQSRNVGVLYNVQCRIYR